MVIGFFGLNLGVVFVMVVGVLVEVLVMLMLVVFVNCICNRFFL